MADDTVARLAAEIADFSPVAWDADAINRLDDHQRAIVDELRLIDELSRLHGGDRPSDDAPSQTGSRWGHLILMERLGHGSFGEVFRAWDTRLDREVALKLVPRRDDGDNGFIEEGRLLAKICHANIVTVYGADSIGAHTGIWMELVRGRTLHDLVHSDGPLSAREAAGIGCDVARAAAAVHHAGLLHRDIKAQNVMREHGGRIVLMDLGAGREGGSGGEADATGTPLYLAPEILDGGSASPQSDLYSIGVLLFFLLTGSYPTAGNSLATLKAAHHSSRRRLLRDARPDLPQPLCRIVDKMLARKRADRYASAGAVEEDLSTLLAGPAAVPSHSRSRRRGLIAATVTALVVVGTLGWTAAQRWMPPGGPAYPGIAVMHLRALGDASTDDYIADGITEALINHLGRSGNMRVVSRTSSAYYRDRQVPLAQLAKDLNVPAVIEGSVRRNGERLSIDLRLVEAATDRIVWTAQRQGTVAEAEALEASISSDVATRLNLTPVAGRPRIASNQAYHLYLRGRHELNKRTAVALQDARRLFEQAAGLDPTFAEAHAGLADAYLLLGAFGVFSKTDTFPMAQRAAEQAIALNAALSQAHAVKGYLLHEAGDVEAGRQQLQRAIELDPSNTTARQWYGLTRAGLLDHDEAIRQLQIAYELDPLSAPISSDLGVAYLNAGQLDAATRQLRRTISVFPDFVDAHKQLGRALQEQGQHPEALQAFLRLVDLGAHEPENYSFIGYNMVRVGQHDEARAIVTKLEDMRRTRPVLHIYDALVLAALGEKELTLRRLASAEADPHGALSVFVSFASSSPGFEYLWSDARFIELVKRRAPSYLAAGLARVKPAAQ